MKKENMKKVLIITYYWPPTGGSGVQRWVKFCKYLPSFGWQPVVYTPENPEQMATDETLLNDIPECVEVLRTRIVEPYGMYRKLVGKKSTEEVNPINSTAKKSFMQKAALWARANFFIPDPRVSWVRPSVKFLTEYLKEHPVDVIITSGPPQSMHLIGRGVKRATGVKWIADFRDPWTNMFFFKHLNLSSWAEKKHYELEQSVLDECDGIISVTPMVQKDFQAKTSTPVNMITNGYDEDDFAAIEEALRNDPGCPDKFIVVHTGLFAVDGNPHNLWKAFAAKCAEDAEFKRRFELRLIGKVDPEIVESINENGLGENLELLGYLPHDRTVLEQMQADMLILPLRIDPEYQKVLPGKIFEYVASRKPVLGIGQEDGAAAHVLSETGSGIMCGWENEEGVAAFLDEQWKRYLSGEKNEAKSDIQKYSRRSITKKLVEMLDSLK